MLKVKTIVISTAMIVLFTLSLFSAEIHKAIGQGDIEKVKSLLDKNPDLIKAIVWRKHSPLHIAAYRGKADIAKLLIDRGADIEALDYQNNTPLCYAAQFGKTDIVKLLLSANAKVDHRNLIAETPLLLAIQSGHVKIIDEYRPENIE